MSFVAGRSGSVISWKRAALGLCGSTPRIRAALHDRDDNPAAGRSIDGYR
jgi:hypothetical protein